MDTLPPVVLRLRASWSMLPKVVLPDAEVPTTLSAAITEAPADDDAPVAVIDADAAVPLTGPEVAICAFCTETACWFNTVEETSPITTPEARSTDPPDEEGAM